MAEDARDNDQQNIDNAINELSERKNGKRNKNTQPFHIYNSFSSF